MSTEFSVTSLLNIFPFIDAATIQQLKAEIPQYLAAALDVDPSYYSIYEFWKNHVNILLFCRVAVNQSSSVAAVFEHLIKFPP